MTTLIFPLRRRWPLAFVLALAGAAFAQPPPAAPAAPAPADSPATPATEPVAPTPAPAAAEAAEADRPLRRLDQAADVPTETPTAPAIRTQERRRQRQSNGGDFPIGDHHISSGSSMRDAVSVFGSTTVDGDVHSDAISVLGDTRIGPGGKVQGAAVSVLGHLVMEGRVDGKAISVLGGAIINGPIGADVVCILGDLKLGPKAVIHGDLVLVGGQLTRDPGAVVHGNEVKVPIFASVSNLEGLTNWLIQCLFQGRLLAFGPHLGWAWMVAVSFLVFYLLLALLFPSVIEKCAITLETRPGTSILASVLTVLLTPIVTVLLVVTIVGSLLVPFVGVGLFFAGLFGKAVMLAWIGRRFTKFFGSGPLGHPVFAVLVGGLIVLLLYTVWGSFLLYKLLSWLGLGVVVYTIVLSMKREKAAAAAAAAATTAENTVVPPPDVPVSHVPPIYSVPVDSPVPPAGASSEAAPLSSGSPDLNVTPPLPPIPPATSPSMGFAAPLVSAGFGAPSAAYGAAVPPIGATGMSEPVGSASSSFGALPPTSPLPPPVASVPPPPRAPLPPRAAPRAFGAPPPVAPAATLPRAGFFPRLAAMALDGVLIGIVAGFLSEIIPRGLDIARGPNGVLLALAIYASIMWKTRGTTIGGIVCGLKVVRVDHRPIDWATAIVRALSCFLSLAVAGLGFIWVVFDDEKQSWHDKIAGTTVVRVPKGVSLL